MFFLNQADKEIGDLISKDINLQIKQAFKKNYSSASNRISSQYFAGYFMCYMAMSYIHGGRSILNKNARKYEKYILNKVYPAGLLQIYRNENQTALKAKDIGLEEPIIEWEAGAKAGMEDASVPSDILNPPVKKLYLYLIGKSLTEIDEEQGTISSIIKSEKMEAKKRKHQEIIDTIKELRNSKAAKISKSNIYKKVGISSLPVDENIGEARLINETVVPKDGSLEIDKGKNTAEYINLTTSDEQISKKDSYINQVKEKAVPVSVLNEDNKTKKCIDRNEEPEPINDIVADESQKIRKIKKSRNFWFKSFCATSILLLFLVLDKLIEHTSQSNNAIEDEGLSTFLEAARQVNTSSVREELITFGYDSDEVFDFIDSLQYDMEYLDFESLINKIHTPLFVGGANNTVQVTYELQDILSRFTSIFTPEVIDSMKLARPSSLYVFANGITVIDGGVWMDKVDGRMMITAINSEDGYYE